MKDLVFVPKTAENLLSSLQQLASANLSVFVISVQKNVSCLSLERLFAYEKHLFLQVHWSVKQLKTILICEGIYKAAFRLPVDVGIQYLILTAFFKVWSATQQ